MTSKERFFRTVERQPVDRLATWLGLPTSKSLPNLLKYFDVKTEKELRIKLGDDLYPVEISYHSETSSAIYAAFNFAKDFEGKVEERTLTAPGFFEDYEDSTKVNDFNWPDPAKYIDIEECKKVIDQLLREWQLWVLYGRHIFKILVPHLVWKPLL
jgi:uroporphyrinogen decarboxylase